MAASKTESAVEADVKTNIKENPAEKTTEWFEKPKWAVLKDEKPKWAELKDEKEEKQKTLQEAEDLWFEKIFKNGTKNLKLSSKNNQLVVLAEEAMEKGVIISVELCYLNIKRAQLDTLSVMQLLEAYLQLDTDLLENANLYHMKEPHTTKSKRTVDSFRRKHIKTILRIGPKTTNTTKWITDRRDTLRYYMLRIRPTFMDNTGGFGFFPKTSLLKRECHGNVSVYFMQDGTAVLITERNIEKGEELVLNLDARTGWFPDNSATISTVSHNAKCACHPDAETMDIWMDFIPGIAAMEQSDHLKAIPFLTESALPESIKRLFAAEIFLGTFAERTTLLALMNNNSGKLNVVPEFIVQCARILAGVTISLADFTTFIVTMGLIGPFLLQSVRERFGVKSKCYLTLANYIVSNKKLSDRLIESWSE